MPITRIDPQQANSLLTQNSKPTLLDVREVWEHEICHLSDAILIPMMTVADNSKLPEKDQTIIVYCHHGIRSLHVCHFLAANGYENLYNLEGGIDAWARSIDSTMTTY
ncbi:MAG: rhodanese-like domain-containing protein [Arenicella sp.]